MAEEDKPVETVSAEEKHVEPTDMSPESTTNESLSIKKHNWFVRFWQTRKGKVVTILAGIVLIVGVLLIVPATRYGLLGLVVKKDVSVMVMDSATNKPVSQVEVTLGDKKAKTDALGKVKITGVPVGNYTLKTTKGYYKNSEQSVTVPVLRNPDELHLSLTATGRPVTVTVVNRLSQTPLAKATVSVQDTSAVTDDKGVANIVLPADKKTLKGKISLENYNDQEVEVKITDDEKANLFTLTPTGTVHYLSKQTGKINVMKANLDGSDAKVVVEGTGNEEDYGTVLLAARDWDYMALLAKRNSKSTGQLYLVNAKTGELKLIDEGNASFQLVGWSNHKFIYTVTRDDRKQWDANTQRLKSYDAETGRLTILDEIAASGSNLYDYHQEVIESPYILENKIVYTKAWNRGGYAPIDKKSAIMSVNADGSQKQRVREFDGANNFSISAKLYEPQEVYFRVWSNNGPAVFYEYENGSVKGVSNTDDNKFFNTFYPTYLYSPNGQKTFWYEPRDGKNTLFVGDKNGKDGKIFANQSEYKTYGWFSDEYVLLSKNDSELYVAPVNGEAKEPVKITNYHKPRVSYPGYGYGYGGL